MSKPSAPATPDYRGAAEATAASQRVNYASPWGTINWTPPAGSGYPGAAQASAGGRMTRQDASGRMGRLEDSAGGTGEPGGDPAGGGNAAGGEGGPSDPPGGYVGQGPITLPAPETSSPYSMMPWTQTLTLSPVQQQLLDAQNQTSLGLAGLQGQGVDAVRGVFNNMPNQSQLTPSVFNPGQTAQDAIMSRVQPMLNRQQGRLQNQLANQGIEVGSQAYKDAMGDFGQQANDAYSQAALRGIDLTQQARQQQMAEQGFYSQMPINLLNAVRGGSTVQTPQMGQQGTGANYLGAAQAQGQAALGQYGADVGAYNNNMAALATLAAAMISDRRVKTDIKRIGTHPLGIGIYEYKIGGKGQIGVMADEVEKVRPDAVVTGEHGFKMVDYSKLQNA